MFGIGRKTAVQERPVEQKTPVQDVPPDNRGNVDPNPPEASQRPYSDESIGRTPVQAPERPTGDVGYGRPQTVTTVERGPMREERALGEEETIHRPSFARMLSGRLLEYTGIAFVLSEIVLLLRLSFTLDAVSPTNGFVSWILTTSGWMVKPFDGIFANHIIRGGGTFEPGTLIAIFVYLAGALIIMSLLGFLVARMPRRTRKVRPVV
jgi:hypothetical protein